MKNGFAELGSVAEFINGAAFKPEDWGDEGKRIVRIQNLTDATKPFNRTKREVAEKLHVHPGDLLVSWSASLGVFEWTDPEVALLNQHIFRVVPDKARVEKRYLRHGLEGALLEMQRHLHGATMQHVNRGEFLATKLYLPPLAEQRRIAEVLDRAEALRAKRRAALAQLDALTQSLFLDLFGEPVTNPKGWELQTIGDELTLQGGYAFKSSDYTKAGVRLVKISNVHKDNLEWSDTDHLPTGHLEEFSDFSLCAGDVVLALTRPIIKSLNSVKIAVVQSSDVPCLLNQRVGRFRFPSNSRLSPAYLLEYCRTKMFFHAVQSFCSESHQPNMSTSQVESIKIAVPPISLQREFARRVTAVEALKTAQRASLAELNALFATLQHRAFRGELFAVPYGVPPSGGKAHERKDA